MTNECLLKQLEGCSESQKQIIMQMLYHNNITIIKSVASRFDGQAEIEDLMQEAYIILCEAVLAYDLNSEYKFITYYSNLLKWGFCEYCSKNNNDLFFTPNMISKMRRYNKITSDNPNISDVGICCLMGINEEQLDDVKNALYVKKAKRYYEQIEGEEDLLFVDTIPDQRDYSEEVEHAEEIKRLHSILKSGINSLEPLQAEIIQKLYYEEKSIQEVADEVNKKESDIRFERSNALKKLRKDKGLRKYYSQQMHPDSIYYSLGLRPVTVSAFLRTHESSVEKAVFRLMSGSYRGV